MFGKLAGTEKSGKKPAFVNTWVKLDQESISQ